MNGLATAATVLVDKSGTILTLGAGAERLLSTTGEEAAGRPLAEVVAPAAHRARFEKGWAKAQKGLAKANGDCSFDAVAGGADDTVFPARIELRPVSLGAEEAVLVEVSEAVPAETRYERLWQVLDRGIGSIDMGYAIVDADDIVVTANRAMVHPLDAKEAIGRKAVDLSLELLSMIDTVDGEPVPKSASGRRRMAKKVLAAGTEPIEVHMKSGRWRWLTGYRAADGCAVYITVDITRVKAAQLEVSESEERFRFILESHPMPVWMADLETGEVLFESRAGAELLGHKWPLEGGELVSTAYSDPADREKLIRRLRRLGTVDNYEVRLKKPDGSPIWISANIRLTKFQGREVLLSGIADLTERKQQEELFRFIMEHHPLPVWMNDKETGEVIYESVAAARQFGREWNPEEKATLKDHYVDPADREHLMERLEKEGSFSDYEVRFKTRDGTPFWAMANARLAEYNGRQVILAGLLDVTMRKEREDQLRFILERHPLPAWLNELESGRILFESPASARMFGREWDPNAEISVTDCYVNPKDREKLVSTLRRDGALDDFEAMFRRADGTPFWARGNVRLVEFQGREMVLAGIVDVTAQKMREEEIIHARELLSDAIEALDEGFALYDRDDRLVMCNARYREMNALSADVLVPGVKWLDFLRIGAERGQYPAAVGRVDKWLEQHAKLIKRRRNYELKEHDDRWYLVSDSPTRQGGTVVTRVDITDRKRAEEERRRSEAVVRQVLDACPVPLQMTRAEDGKILYRSPATIELFGKAKSSLEYYANSQDRLPYVEELKRTGSVDDYEVRLQRADGTPFWAAVSSRLIDFRGERVIVSNTYDLTDRLAVEEELARQREALHQSEKLSALGELLAGVAHELNNPLSVVVGQALLLKEQTRDKKIVERAAKIGNAADRCARIVKTFLAMARQQPAQSRAAYVNEMVEAALEVTGYSLRARGVDLKLDLAEALPPVWVDTDQLNQVLTNLILNAEHALREVEGDKTVTVSSAFNQRSGRIVVKVSDNGPGIPEAIKSRIFEPFFTTKEVGSGTGIGLAFCHRIIESHGGSLRVDSRPGSGATFIIELPVSQVAGEAVAEAEAQTQPDDRLAILVIDDETDVLEMISEVLEADGHRVTTANSGAAALGKIGEQRFDIILSDLKMPNLDGPSLFELLKERDPQLSERVAFITGDTMSPNARSFLKSAGRPYIEKPVRPEEIRALVHQLAAGTQGRAAS